LREMMPGLAASPAPAPATFAAFPGFFAASPAPYGDAPAQILMEKGRLGDGEVAGDSVYNILKAQDAGDKDYKILATLVDRAGLAGALSDPGARITVLAPTDEAFKRFAEAMGKQPDDLKDEKPETLKAILLQHVIAEPKPLPSFSAGETVPTKGVAGIRVESVSPVKLAVIGGPGDGTTAETGVTTAGGKGHIIAVDTVLLPPPAKVEEMGPGSI